MDEFKKCPEGHVYESEYEECPYCNGKEMEEFIDRLKSDASKKIREKLENMAMCYIMGPKDI